MPQPYSELAQELTAQETAELHDIFEAVYRHQFLNNASAAQQGAQAYFLFITGEDLPPDFMERFSGHMPPVKNGSQFTVGEGLRFRIDGWRRISPDKFEVGGGYYEGNLSASGNRYIVVRESGAWVVESDTMLWIS